MTAGTVGGRQSAHMLSDVWLTPRWILDVLGDFDLDPCAAPPPRPWPTAAKHISLPDDGLVADWTGRIWLNPPYGTQARRWLERMARHGRGVALTFARTDTAWFQDHVLAAASALLFLRGRVVHCRADGHPSGDNGGAPSVLVAYGDDDAEVLAGCGLRGAFVRLTEPPP